MNMEHANWKFTVDPGQRNRGWGQQASQEEWRTVDDAHQAIPTRRRKDYTN